MLATLIKADLSFLATVIRVVVKERRQQFINPSLWAHSEKGRERRGRSELPQSHTPYSWPSGKIAVNLHISV